MGGLIFARIFASAKITVYRLVHTIHFLDPNILLSLFQLKEIVIRVTKASIIRCNFICNLCCNQSQKTQGFCVADFATLSDERRSRSKIFPLFIWITKSCVRKFEGLERSKLLGISQTTMALPSFQLFSQPFWACNDCKR